MTLKEMQVQEEESDKEKQEKKDFQKYYNERMKEGNKTGCSIFKMDGFKRIVIDSFDNTVIFEERPNIFYKYKDDKKAKWREGKGTTLCTANLMWEAWLYRGSLNGIQTNSKEK